MSASAALTPRRHRSVAIAPAAAPAGFGAPPSRAGVVPRPRLLRRLIRADAPMALIVAPAGYGKTTLLAEWAARDERPFAWVSLETLGGRAEQAVAAVTALLEDVAGCGRPHVVVVDDAHLVATQRSMRRVAELASRMPAGSIVALASRRHLAVPVGRLRAHRLLVELRARDLAMTRLEAAVLLDAVGIRLDGALLDRLLARTEGWPVGLYLAAVAIGEQEDVERAIAGFTGADRLVADYVRDELLADLRAGELAFLRRTSILSRLTAPLCDAVLETDDAAAVLARLARGNVLMEPLDRCDAAFRHHPLVAEALRAELRRHEPALEPVLHGRAADWLAAHGEGSAAVGHAVAGHDARRAGRLLWSLAPSYAGTGRGADLGRWLRPFSAYELAAHPALALSAACHHLAAGRRDLAERAAEAAARALPPDEEAGELAAGVLIVRACVAREGIGQMGEDAARACALAPAGSAWQSAGLYLEGVARHLGGEREAARSLLEDGARRAITEVHMVEALCHAQLALLAIEHDGWEAARGHADDARASLAQLPARTPAHALVLAVGAAVAAHRGDVAQGRREAADALHVLTSLEDFIPWYLAAAQIWLARAEIRLSDAATARMLLSRAARHHSHVDGAPVLGAWLHDAWERADAFAAGATGCGPALTNAELRVLRFLPSHLSFREIGVRLHVSTNTVKTQALAVYRKLDATCRSEAVARGRTVGLIDG
jgi:LuxR family maltose regulon positive regulatory protein